MFTPVLELEGTAEEIQTRLADFAGQRIHVTISQADVSNKATLRPSQRKLSITEIIRARAESILPEDRAQLPADLADQHDHYIYGWPKK